MKSIEEIQEMVETEITKYLNKDICPQQNENYLNSMLGDTSFLLAGLLDSLLKREASDWDHSKWIDDCLINEVDKSNNKIGISGIMIWGKLNTTEQWTDPFYFELRLPRDEANSKRHTFLFSDLKHEEITYRSFRENRNYWDATERNWKYIINW